jgi:hypothetical protein
MAANYFNLPAAQMPRNALLDFSQLNDGIDRLGKGLTQNYDNETNRLLGAALKTGDYGAAAGVAAERGNPDAALKLTQYQESRADRAEDREWKLAERVGNIANAALQSGDPNALSSAHVEVLRMMGNDADRLDPAVRNDPKAFLTLAAHKAGKYIDPQAQKLKGLQVQEAELSIAERRQNIASGGKGNAAFAQREQAARSYGLDPQSPAGQAFILTGKMPREDQQPLTATDKKAILEADEMIAANRQALDLIGEAKRLSPKAYEGFTAGTRATIVNNIPFYDGTEESQATTNFDNVVTGQALGQLKAIFGGNPTEGERKILLEMQGSSGKPHAVRMDILRRAEEAAQRRLRFNEERANQLRGGTFYKPQGGQAPQQQQPPAPKGPLPPGDYRFDETSGQIIPMGAP